MGPERRRTCSHLSLSSVCVHRSWPLQVSRCIKGAGRDSILEEKSFAAIALAPWMINVCHCRCFQAERSARILRGVLWTFPFVGIGINHLSGAILAMEFPCITEQGKIVQELSPTVGDICARTMRGVLLDVLVR